MMIAPFLLARHGYRPISSATVCRNDDSGHKGREHAIVVRRGAAFDVRDRATIVVLDMKYQRGRCRMPDQSL